MYLNTIQSKKQKNQIRKHQQILKLSLHFNWTITKWMKALCFFSFSQFFSFILKILYFLSDFSMFIWNWFICFSENVLKNLNLKNAKQINTKQQHTIIIRFILAIYTLRSIYILNETLTKNSIKICIFWNWNQLFFCFSFVSYFFSLIFNFNFSISFDFNHLKNIKTLLC